MDDKERLKQYELKLMFQIKLIENEINELKCKKKDKNKLKIRKGIEFALAFYYNLYTVFENPLYIWGAYKLCRDYNHPLVDWIKEYLDTSANSILKIDSTKKDRGTRKINIALNIKDRHLSTFQRNINKIEAYILAIEYKNDAKREKNKIDLYFEVGKIIDNIGDEEERDTSEKIRKWYNSVQSTKNKSMLKEKKNP